jgi:hypothetical protein
LASAPAYLAICILGTAVIPYGAKSYSFVALCFAGTLIAAVFWLLLAFDLAYWLTPPRIERDVGNPVKLDLS